jgi:hypothetical protein
MISWASVPMTRRKREMAKYIVHNGNEETEVEADTVSVVADDGTKIYAQSS